MKLEIDSVFFGYNKTGELLLSDIYLQLETKGITGIFGLNGSGKSTLLKIIYGTLNSSAKNIRIDGKSINKSFLIENSIGYLPQHTIIPSHLTVKSFINLYVDKTAKSELLNDQFITKIYSNRVSALSGGERRYLEVSILLLLNHNFLMLDEPFSEIEPIYKEELINKIKYISSQKGIIITDHDYRSTFSVCTDYYLLHNGSLKKVKSKEEFKNWYLPDTR